ncbi:2502_t:CDS:2, partial [Dentiscutata heterogama]
MDLYNYHLCTDWNMDDDLYWGCDVEKCEYWDLDVEFLTSTEAAGYDTKWIRVGFQSVALKTINNSIDPISDLLNEIESNIQVVDDPHFIRCLGITQDSKTHNYMIVMEYATSGSLRAYMNENIMDAYKKGQILWSISKGLYNLHEKNLVHQDFHPGNLLLINGFLTFDKFILPTSTLPSYKLHSEAIYTSRLFNTTSTKSVNASNSMKMFRESTLRSLCK